MYFFYIVQIDPLNILFLILDLLYDIFILQYREIYK